MEGRDQLPKATVIAFLRELLQKEGSKLALSKEFIEAALQLSAEYIYHVANEANNACTASNRKTITKENLYDALKKFNLEAQIPVLDGVDAELKEKLKLKKERYANCGSAGPEAGEAGPGPLSTGDKLLLHGGAGENPFERGEEEQEDYQ